MASTPKRPSGAPRAKVVPHELEHLGHVRVDDYYWMNRRDDPEVVRHLEQENAYAKAVMGHTGEFEQALFEEIKGRIKQDDTTVPYRLGDYLYRARFEQGKEYPLYCRSAARPGAEEQVILDANLLARGHEFFQIGSLAVSAGQDLVAYTVDTVGRRVYTLQFKDLKTGRTLGDRIPETTSGLAWANDDKTVFYGKPDPQTLRSYRIYRHVLGTPAADDQLVYEEDDDTFWTRVWKTKSKRFLIIGSFQTLTTECRYLEADDPGGEFRVLRPRSRGHEYVVGHFGEHFYFKTNLEARNFRLMRAPIQVGEGDPWEEVIPHREHVLLEDFDVFRDHLVLAERENGLVRLRVRSWTGKTDAYLQFDEPAYLAWIDDNYELDSKTLRFGYTSLTTPKTIYDHEMETGERKQLKQDEVLGGFDAERYRTERLWATASDGTRIPISIVYRKETGVRESNPLLLYGYGAYGYSLDASFQSDRLSLVDRGFVYAIAHVRGGEEMGRLWYEDGRLLNKRNSFTDFVACAEHLVAQGYSRADRLFAMGRSAGGLLMGAVANLRPDLFCGIVAGVPFVDVVTTMLDESIPLTTFEYDEWGNPADRTYYDYMLSYSPYDNVEQKAYPHILVTTGFHDSQVQYWEPAKWIAKLRASKTDPNRLLLKTNMDAGHGGASGRYRRYRETAFEYAFLLDLAGRADSRPK